MLRSCSTRTERSYLRTVSFSKNPSIIGIGVQFKISLSDICPPTVMHSDMIPGLVLWRAALGHHLIPFIAAIKLQVHAHHYAPIVKAFVVYRLPDQKFCFRDCHSISPF